MEEQIEEQSELDYFDKSGPFPPDPPQSRARPKTAKVSGFVNNLREQSYKYSTNRASNVKIV